MLNKKLLRALPMAVFGAAIALTPMTAIRAASAVDGNINLSSPMLADTEPVTVYSLVAGPVPSFDPQAATDEVSITPIENLFLGLADVDPTTATVRPELATEWSVSDDGTVWTFKIRTDVPWVKYDPATKETKVIRMVTAKDIEYGIKRACDTRLGSSYASVAGATIKGCDVVVGLDAAKLTEKDFDQIAVTAKDDATLEITTLGALGYFESELPFWFLRPVPKETIDEFGDKWTDAANIVTNGPFMLEKYDANVERSYVKNPNYVEVNDSYGGNVERREAVISTDNTTSLALYDQGQIDTVGVPRSELARIRADETLSKQLQAKTDVNIYYFRFAFDKAPMDKVEVRRAFSASVDRATFVSEVIGGRGVPMAHMTPPGVFGSVAVNEVGLGSADNLGFDAAYGKEQMKAAGFPNCEGFPEIRVLTYQGSEAWGEFLQNAVKTNLGCDSSKIVLESAEFSVLLKAIDKSVPTEQRPHIWTLGWGADYPDANNFFFDAGISCKASNESKRPCTAVDEKIDAAAKETDADKRITLYKEIEEGFFGKDGEFPIIPLYSRVVFSLVQPWFTGPFETDATFGGAHWQSYKIDQAAQLAKRGGAGAGLVVPTLEPTPEATAAK